ncbi:MAG TPA: PQQ-binding-like beta-propeller repeat protein, partial [Candidatus Thermoplasmatota archaeon]|nr:PQQ-binding-like beta-propeller repeat protein [Candidatus Thermoplasmatota archaeon]
MRLDRALKLSLTGSIVIVLLVGSLFPSRVVASSHVDIDDGIYTDDFHDNNSIQFLDATSGCTRDSTTNSAHMVINHGVTKQNYSFATTANHKAYAKTTFFSITGQLFGFGRPGSFFLSPSRLGVSRNEFGDTDYDALNAKNETRVPGHPNHPNYAWTSSSGIQKNVIHYFRFQLSGPAEVIGDLTVQWYGKAVNAQRIEMYYWHYGALMSGWVSLAFNTDTEYQTLMRTINETQLEEALDDNNYIDLCVVAYGVRPTLTCTLYSDYILLQSLRTGLYRTGYGYVQTTSTIDLTSNTGYWELLDWKDDTPAGTNITYQILYNSAGTYVPVSNSLLNGNEEGFSTPPVSLTPLKNYYTNIKLQANLSTNDPTVTPSLYNWTVTWQTGNRWQDHFHSDLRVEEKDNVEVNYGSVNISLVRGDWPMFGQNPSNTRASTGSAVLTDDRYWYSVYFDPTWNETPVSMVLNGQSLYVASQLKNTDGLGRIIRYSKIDVPTSNIGKEYSTNNQNFYKVQPFDKFGKYQSGIVGSPAISGQYLVVATGRLGYPNYVLGFNKDDPSSNPWVYNDTSSLCYWGSPTIANGYVYLTGWSGDESFAGYQVNNEVLALDLESGAKKWSFTFPSDPKPSHPSWSFSTPAYSNGTVVVGCMNDLNDSLFALDATTGELLWNTSVGTIGKAAPVIYDNTVYVVSENNTVPMFFPRLDLIKKTQVMLSAVDLKSGEIRWQSLLGNQKYNRWSHLGNPTFSYAQTTPVIAGGVLYVVSPDWNISAFDVSKDNTRLWSVTILGRAPLHPSLLLSSPAYSGGYLYVNIPGGTLTALNTSSKDFSWQYPTKIQLITTDPITSNGLVFFGDDSGEVYSLGNYFVPNTQVNGTVISKPITLPKGYWWKSFYAVTNETSGLNSITFRLLDSHDNIIKSLTSGAAVVVANATLGRTIRLRADLWASNGSVNPQLLSWNITFIQDITPPYIDRSSLIPNQYSSVWVNQIVPEFTIKVKDNGTGLLVSSATYRLNYVAHNVTHVVTRSAPCTGINGTTSIQTIDVNISQLSDYRNITALRGLTFNISDLAGNLRSLAFSFQQDTQPPSSRIISSLKSKYNTTSLYIPINAVAWDNTTSASNASGVRYVRLYYRYSPVDNFTGTSWIYFANSTSQKPQWQFNFTDDPTQDGGYFQLATVAYDNAGNNESLPASGDVSFLYDWTIPSLPGFSGETLWFNEQPQLSTTFTDDFQLDMIQYRPNFDSTWKTIASDINTSSYSATWQLDATDWQRMTPGQLYYVYFRITDIVGNVRNVISTTEALSVGKDLGTSLNVVIGVPPGQNHVITTGNFTVTASVNDSNGSGVSEVALYYQYSNDNRTWTDWT